MLQNIMKFVGSYSGYLTVLARTVIFSCSVMNTAQALPFNKISQLYFFGDSLTDSGFNDLYPFSPELPVGKAPTFTTYGGYIWSQYVARDIMGFVLPEGYPSPSSPDTITNNTTPLIPGTWPVSGTLDGINYACGGSTTNSVGNNLVWAPSLHNQVSHFLSTAATPLDPEAVFFVWSGANDLLVLLEGATLPTQLQLLQVASTATKNIANEVEELSAHGAKRVVVLSLPNIGFTPLVGKAAAADPTLPASMKTLTFTFNSMLNQELGKVVAKYNTKILYIDVYDILDDVILATKAGKPYVVAGQSFQFVNYTDTACGDVPSLMCPKDTPEGYIFADDVHPTDMANRLLSLVVETEIKNWL